MGGEEGWGGGISSQMNSSGIRTHFQNRAKKEVDEDCILMSKEATNPENVGSTLLETVECSAVGAELVGAYTSIEYPGRRHLIQFLTRLKQR